MNCQARVTLVGNQLSELSRALWIHVITIRSDSLDNDRVPGLQLMRGEEPAYPGAFTEDLLITRDVSNDRLTHAGVNL